MSLPRLLMLCGMLLLLVGLVYGLSLHGRPEGMVVELTLLALGAVIFVGARLYEKKHS